MPFKAAPCFFALSLVALAGCNNTNSFDPQNSPYGEQTSTTVMHSTSQYSGVTSNTVQQVVGQKTINGKTYDRMVSSNISTPTMGLEWWIDVQPGASVEIAGIDASQSHAITPILAVDTATFDPPVVVDLNPPVNVPQQLSGNLTITMQGSTTPHTVQTTAQYTLVETNAKVNTSVGTIYGCSHFSGSISSTGDIVPSSFAGITISGELWYHPSFGIVALSSPQFGLTDQMSDSSDCGTPDANGYTLIRKMAILDATHTSFVLSSYDCSQQFDADKDVEAQMLLEIRFVDDGKATTGLDELSAFLGVTFEDPYGQFYYTPTPSSPVSILHPEENGQGFKYYYAYVSAGDRYMPTNGIYYSVNVSPDTNAFSLAISPLRVSARVYYKKWTP